MASGSTSKEKYGDVVNCVEDAPGAEAASKDAILDAAIKGQVVTGYETLTLWETVKTFKISSLVCFFAAFSAATDGYQIGMNSGIIANKGFVHQFATTTGSNGQPALASPVIGGWNSIQSVGQIVGMTTLPFLSSRYGRKAAMYTYWLVLASSIIAESLARKWQVWLVAKLLAGIGVGSMQSTLPTYISELAPVRIRGGLLMMYSLWWTVGGFFAYIALQDMNKQNPNKYLDPIYTQWAQIGLMLLIYIFLPESPAWCATRGKTDLGKKVLRKLHHGVEGYDVDQQFEVLVMAVEHERAVAIEQHREKWYAIFRGIDGLRTVIALWPNVANQFIGLTLFSTYGAYFFQQAGLADPFKIKCITASINIATSIIIVLIADKIGRRRICCSATTLMWLACVAIGTLGVVKKVKATDYIFVLFACFWNIGLTANGAAAMGFLGEISSQRLRPYTAGFSAAASCVVGIAMGQLTPYMVNANKWNWGFKTGWFYAGVGLPFAIGAWLLIPETAGRSVGELDELFERKVKPWQFSKTETATQRLVNNQKSRNSN